MLETVVIGDKEWVRGFLCEADIRCLEDFDCEMRIRFLQQKRARSYQELVEEHGDKMPTQCEHGIPLYRKCGMCRALRG